MSKISIKGVIAGSFADFFVTQLVVGLTLIAAIIGGYSHGNFDPAHLEHASPEVWMAAFYDDAPLSTVVAVLGSFGTVIGGYIAGRVARREEVLNGLCSTFPLLTIGIFYLAKGQLPGPLWKHIILLAATLLFGLIGGGLARTRERANTEAPTADLNAAIRPGGNAGVSSEDQQPWLAGSESFSRSFFKNLTSGLRALFFLRVRAEDFRVSPVQASALVLLFLLVAIGAGYFERGIGSTIELWYVPYPLATMAIIVLAAVPSAFDGTGKRDYLVLPITLSSMLIWYALIVQPVPWISWREGWGGTYNRGMIYRLLYGFGDWWLIGSFILAGFRVVGVNTKAVRLTIVVYTFVMVSFVSYFQIAILWKEPHENNEKAATTPNLELLYSEDIFRIEPALLGKAFAALEPSQPGHTDLYFMGVAAYAYQDVFMKEVKTVADVFLKQFNTTGHSLLLINNLKTVDKIPMASNDNIRRSLKRIGQVIDRNKDIVVLYVTSHGSKDEGLAMGLGPFSMKGLSPESLKAMLNDSGIFWRVIVISGCHSGIFVPALANDHTLVITASDADHLSYGCSNEGDMTEFARAIVNRLSKTRDIVAAFQGAQKDIDRDETEKHLLHSNPQMSIGPAISKKLAGFESQLGTETKGVASSQK